MDTVRQIRFIWKPLVFLACLVPAVARARRCYLRADGHARCKPGRGDSRPSRQLGTALHHDCARRHAAATPYGLELANAIPPHARTVRVLLRAHALPGLVDPRPGCALVCDRRGSRETAVHYGGIRRARHPDRDGDYVDERDAPPPRPVLAAIALWRLRRRHPRCLALLVAGEERRSRTADLCRSSSPVLLGVRLWYRYRGKTLSDVRRRAQPRQLDFV